MISKKSIRKRKNRQIYKKYLFKQNDNGLRHYHCPTCFNKDKILVGGNDAVVGGFICNRCNTKWVIIS